MADIISNALDFLHQKLAAHASVQVQYFQGANSVTLSAVVGTPTGKQYSQLGLSPTAFDLTQGNPINMNRDFSLLASDLVINGQQVLPQEGDEVWETTSDGVTAVYQVMPTQQGGLAWEYETGYRGPQARLTVHTKYVSQG